MTSNRLSKHKGICIRILCAMIPALFATVSVTPTHAQISQMFQLVVPPAQYEPDYPLGSDVYLTYDYTSTPTDQKPYLVTKKESPFNTADAWMANDTDYTKFENELKDISREEFYNDCIWTSNVIMMVYMPKPNFSNLQEIKQMHVEEFNIYIEGDSTPIAQLADKANDIIHNYNPDNPYEEGMESPLAPIKIVLMRTAVNREHKAYLTFRATYGENGNQTYTMNTRQNPYTYKHTFPAVRFNGVTHNVECVSGTDAASENMTGSFADRGVNLTKDEALEHEYSITVGLTDGNNIDPAIIDMLEPLRNTVIKLNVNGVEQTRNIYFTQYNNPGSAVRLSHCDPNNFLTVNSDGSYTRIANKLSIETSFTTAGLRVFGIAGDQGDDARRDEIDLTIPSAEIVAPVFEHPRIYKNVIPTDNNMFVQEIDLAVAGLDISAAGTSLSGHALRHSEDLSSLSMKVDGRLLMPGEPAQPLYNAADLENPAYEVAIAQSEPFATITSVDDNMMGKDRYDLSLAYTYLFRSGRIIGSAVGAITFDEPKTAAKPAAAPARADADRQITHSTFTTHYATVPVYIDEVLTSVDRLPGAEAEAEAEYFTLQGLRVAKADLTSGVYVERRGTKVRKVIVK